MAWTNETAGQVAHKAPVTVDLFRMIIDNLQALADGDSGAPSVLPNIAANFNAGDIGTYCFARCTANADVAFGAQVSGLDLDPASALIGMEQGSYGINLPTGSALSGTWECAGNFVDEFDIETGGGVTMGYGVTLWLRVA